MFPQGPAGGGPSTVFIGVEEARAVGVGPGEGCLGARCLAVAFHWKLQGLEVISEAGGDSAALPPPPPTRVPEMCD